MNLRNLSMLACNEDVTLWYYWTCKNKNTVKYLGYLEEARGIIKRGDFILISGCDGAMHVIVSENKFGEDDFELVNVN